MRTVRWTVLLCLAIARPEIAAADSRGDQADPVTHAEATNPIRLAGYQARRTGRGLTVRWIGQDGHDFVSSSDRHEPNETQDVHIALGGLDPRREVTFVEIRIPSGHRWQYNPEPRNWHAHLIREKGATVGDVWVDPLELAPGSACHVLVRYDDNTTAEADFRSRRLNTRLRVASAMARARWIGQDRQDLAGLGASVGPDGLQDVRIHLDNLSPKYPVKSIRVETSGGLRYEFGLNPQVLNNAEFVKDPKEPRQGDLYFQPDRDLSGQRIRLGIFYEGAVPDAVAVVAGRCEPRLPMPTSPLPKIEELKLSASWLGQDGSKPSRPGDVHVVLGGLPDSGRVVAVELTDTVREAWQYRGDARSAAHLDGAPGSLDVRFRADRRSADVYFAPYRETSHETYSVRVIGADGRTWQGRFPGGASDLRRLAPMPEPTRAEAKPGDDLQGLLDRNGTVVLAKGTYRLRRPLVLNRPSTLTSSGDATLLFAQDAGDAPWRTAIKVRCGNTTLEGFAVRFAGPVRWDSTVSYGPAVIGMPDNTEPGSKDPMHQVVFRKLDIEAPPAEDPGRWVEAPRLFRLVGALSGAVVGNRLRGGTIEFFHGPWAIVDNEYRGTQPGTISHCFIAGHWTHDLMIRGNRLSSPSPSGKTWRFLVLTNSGLHDRVERNVVEGIGARDDDTIPWSNEPEVILTESYSLKYEGKVMAASADGRVLRVGRPQGSEVHPGDAVAILSGPSAGTWRRVLHVLDPSTFLLDEAMPKDADAVSISQGFVGEAFEGNRIDIRGGRRSVGFVLPGNHFGTRVVDNHVLGGGGGLDMKAYATEHPGIWGWSHVPFLGAIVEKNVLEDNDGGCVVGVEHHEAIKTNKGRSYMTVQLRDNVVRWTEPFLAARRRAGVKEPLAGLTLGYRLSVDPDELLATATGNTLDAPAGYRESPGMVVRGARLNGQKLVNRRYRLPAARGSADAGRGEARSGGSRPVR